MLLSTVLLLLLLEMFPAAAGIAERVGGADALFKVIVSSFLVLSFYTIHCVFSFKSSPFSPIFGYVDPIIVVLNPSFDWFFIFFFFKFLFEEIVDVIFPSFSRSSNRSVSLKS